MKLKKMLSGVLAGAVFITSLSLLSEAKGVRAATVNSIPNTNREIKNYDKGFLSLTGYASVNNAVNDRSKYVGTSYYRIVNNEKDFLNAILDAQKGKVKVIEITRDLNLGWKELNLSSSEKSKYSFVAEYEKPTNGYTNPTLASTGVSKLNISNTNGLTIFSTSGKTIRHTELKLQSSSNDIAIRNLKFDDMWQFDDTGKHKEVGWTFIKVNGANNVWIDHCKFTNAADGNVDIENGSSGLTFSWCEFGAETTENPSSDSAIYKSVNYMEEKYNSGQLKSDSIYYKMRKAGANKNQIMAFEAYHSKCSLVGSGDKDFVNYIDSNGKDYKDGNQRLRLTLAYCKYNNVGQRVPMIRQGVGHMFNCVIDNTGHMNVLKNVSAIKNLNVDNLSRCINARNGAAIGADTCVFNGVNEPIVGTERQGDETGNMNKPWDTLFANAYNNVLIVNSKVSNDYGVYTGSSWDNNGVNLFTRGYKWNNKSTLGKWAWSSSINGVQNMKKSITPTTPFTFTYNYNEKLPYSYNVVSLNNVESVVKSYSGAGKVKMSASEWLKTNYTGSTNNTQNTSLETVATNVKVGEYYRIKNVNSGKYLSVPNNNSGAKAVQTSSTGDNTLWQVVSGSQSGYIKLASQVGDGRKVLDVTGGSSNNLTQLQIWGSGGSSNQDFKLNNLGNGKFGILTRVSGDVRCLDVNCNSLSEGANIIQYDYKGGTNQQWVFEKVNYTHPIVDGGIYYIKNYNSNLYLDVVNGKDANGTNIRQWGGNGADAQKFKVVSTGDGYYKLVSQVGDKRRVIDVNGNSSANGANISIFDDRGTDNQKFKLIDNGNGVFQVATKVSGNKSLMEVVNADKKAGANVQQWVNNSNNCQRWIFEIVR